MVNEIAELVTLQHFKSIERQYKFLSPLPIQILLHQTCNQLQSAIADVTQCVISMRICQSLVNTASFTFPDKAS